ncbi:NAD(P)-dependent dehydrogenase (short-subunit alcohol dehydrogenase family) [Bradyrhizobium japonicum]|jgi:NAD(P)-dependent dehydrogenase (short-subunit alcohol dehydrogenase family)
MTDWSTADIPSLSGKTAVVTGATGGLGYETAMALAGAGAIVILTGRNDAKGLRAIEGICERFPNALIAYEHLDLASLASVADFTRRFAASNEQLDLLINNAGVMALPKRQQTEDGFEMQLGTNYLGHYALTAQLLPQLRRAKAPRIVNLSSLALRRDQFRRSARQAFLSSLARLLPVQAGDADVFAGAAAPQPLRRLGPDEPCCPSRLRADRSHSERARRQQLPVACEPLAPAFHQPLRSRGRAAHGVRGDLAGCRARRLIRSELVLRIEGVTRAGEDHAAGEGFRRDRHVVGCLGDVDRCIFRRDGGRRMSRGPVGDVTMQVIIFGATGMVGQGVLRECLIDTGIDRVLVVGRSPTGVRNAKLTEITHGDFTDYSAIEAQLTGFDACFFCLGVSSIGMSEDRYRHLTYDLTLAAATTLAKLNPQMTFVYVTGAGTDSTEQGSRMWARIKGKTENDLLKLPFRGAYMFRPGAIQPLHGARSKTAWVQAVYAATGPLWSALRRISPRLVTSTEQMGRAMIRVAREGYPRKVLEMEDINSL